ncbi:hypothetical protein C8J57DRAFT_1497689 [Mycena rebaudengoi]|nr:hypothetical protein C8J57DRAFT_1497689 [Mycena rebaudengoi]
MSIPANGSPGLWRYISPLKAYPVLPVLQAINVEGQQPIHPGVVVETIQTSWDTPFFAATRAHQEPISRGSQLRREGKIEGMLEDPFPYLRPPFDNSSFDSAVIPDPEEEEYQGKLDRYHRAYLGEHHELRRILNIILRPLLGQVSDHKEHLSSIEMQVPNNSRDEPPLYKALSGSAVPSALSVKNNSFALDVYKPGYAHMDAPIDPSITQLAKQDRQHQYGPPQLVYSTPFIQLPPNHLRSVDFTVSRLPSGYYYTADLRFRDILCKGSRVLCAGKVHGMVQIEELMFQEEGFAFVRAADHLVCRTYILGFAEDQVALPDKEQELKTMVEAYQHGQ